MSYDVDTDMFEYDVKPPSVEVRGCDSCDTDKVTPTGEFSDGSLYEYVSPDVLDVGVVSLDSLDIAGDVAIMVSV